MKFPTAVVSFLLSSLALAAPLGSELKIAFEKDLGAACSVKENREQQGVRYFKVDCESASGRSSFQVNIREGVLQGEGSFSTKADYAYGYCDVNGQVRENGTVALALRCFSGQN